MEKINLEMRARREGGREGRKKEDRELMSHLELTASPDFSKDMLRAGEGGGEYEQGH